MDPSFIFLAFLNAAPLILFLLRFDSRINLINKRLEKIDIALGLREQGEKKKKKTKKNKARQRKKDTLKTMASGRPKNSTAAYAANLEKTSNQQKVNGDMKGKKIIKNIGIEPFKTLPPMLPVQEKNWTGKK